MTSANKNLITDFINQYSVEFSICTLVTRPEEYEEMKASFESRGFINECAEYIIADNSKKNMLNAYEAVNLFIRASKGKYIIVCHQDILLIDDINILRERIRQISEINPSWGLLGNSGGTASNAVAVRITDPHMENATIGNLPCKVVSLDENFILLKASANLAVSNNLSGFHLYGTDLCMIASVLGYDAYIVDFHLKHKSAGNVKDRGEWSFEKTKARFIDKYQQIFYPRFIRTPCTSFFITPWSLLTKIMNGRRVKKIFLKLFM